MREACCSVGVQGDNGTYEIFIYGGVPDDWNTATTTNSKVNSMDEVYVLSLPSFSWFKAAYPAQYNRYGHTCQVVGNRQLLSFGGNDYTHQSDPFTLGLGIFDMTEMTWSDSYNASAAAYRTPDVIKSYISANGVNPLSWDNETLAQVFEARNDSGNSTSSNPGPSSSTEHSLSGGGIAGIAVGAVAGVAMIALLIWFLMRRRKRARQNATVAPSYAPPGYH